MRTCVYNEIAMLSPKKVFLRFQSETQSTALKRCNFSVVILFSKYFKIEQWQNHLLSLIFSFLLLYIYTFFLMIKPTLFCHCNTLMYCQFVQWANNFILIVVRARPGLPKTGVLPKGTGATV